MMYCTCSVANVDAVCSRNFRFTPMLHLISKGGRAVIH